MINRIQKCLSSIDKELIDKLRHTIINADQILMIGNGGSNAIVSHIAVDYVKFLNKKAIAFSDASMLTAYMNDYSVENAYKQFIADFHRNNGIVILVSSSGNSKNIYNAAEYCKNSNIPFILLTGFKNDNLTRNNFKDSAIIDYWVDAESYGVVECVHQIFLHSIIDN